MKQQIIVSGIGGQGVLFLTKALSEAALEGGFPVLTSETHGMAMRGGTVVSHVKVGAFMSPLVRSGRADVGLFLHHGNLAVHRHLFRSGGSLFVNTEIRGDYHHVDASRAARDLGSSVIANLVLLGYAIGKGSMFCEAEIAEKAIRKISRERHLELNLKGFRSGLRQA